MAKLTEQTEAIIQRLKEEGELVRASGPNSIRSVKLEMSKFGDLFDSINSNVEAQTQLMRQQLGLAQAAVRKAETQEQLNEVDTSYTDTTADDASKEETKKITDKVIDGMEKGFNFAAGFARDNFSMKNMAIAGAGLFVGFNLLKGFVNEQTDGGFDKMLEGLKGFGPDLKDLKTTLGNARVKLDEFSTIDVESMKESLKTMNLAVKDMLDPETGSLSILSKNLASISTSFANFAEKPIGTALNFVWENITAIGVGAAGLRWWFVRARMDLENGTRTINGQPWWKRMLGLKDVKGPVAPVPRSQMTPEAKKLFNNKMATQFPNLFQQQAGGGLKDLVPDGKGGVKVGGYSSQATINAALQSGLTGANGAAYKFITGLLTKVGLPVLAGVTAYQILVILSDDGNYPDKESKAQAMGPIIGGLIGGIGGAIIAGALASMTGVGLGWGTLLFGIVGGIVGSTTVGSTKIGYYVAKAALGEKPPVSPTASYEGMSPQEIMKAHGFNSEGQYIGTGNLGGNDYSQFLSEEYQRAQANAAGVTPAQPTITFPNTAPPGLLEAQRDQEIMLDLMEDLQKAEEKHKLNKQQTDELREYLEKLNNPEGLTPSNFNLDRGKLTDMFAGGGGVGLINAPVNNNISPVNISNGGNVVNEFTYGSGNNSGSLNLSIYGVTSGLVSA